MQVNSDITLWMALGKLFGATKQSTVSGCLAVRGKDQAVHQGQLSPALSLREGQQKAQGTLRSTSICPCLPPPADCLLGSVTEVASGSTQVA